MVERPPAAAIASQFSDTRRHMFPRAETASVCMAALLGWRSIAWMMATCPCPDTMDVLHWSLPEIDARKKQACFATPASVMWLPSAAMASGSESRAASAEHIWSVTASRESVASSSARCAGVSLYSGFFAAFSSSGATLSSTAIFACSRPLEVRARASSERVVVRSAPHAAKKVAGVSAKRFIAGTITFISFADATNCCRWCSCTSIAARHARKPARATPASSGWRRIMAVTAAMPRTPSCSRASPSPSTTARVSRIGVSAVAVPRTASADDTSASTAPSHRISGIWSLSFWQAIRICAAASASAMLPSASTRMKCSFIMPPPNANSSSSSSPSSADASSAALSARRPTTAAGSSSADAPGRRLTMLERLTPCDSNCWMASASASSGGMSRSSTFSFTASSNVSCDMRA
mmetsp:Transcript_38399/g.101223  ORF Transcript_38399/g.101223 Transcript_38399/m.101223 type:complete len:409 (+) Transcript_38399:866-2092(+)